MPELHPKASRQLKMARHLLQLLPRLDANRFQKAMEKLRATHQVEGPRACAWMANTMANSAPYGKDRRFMLEQADLFIEESCVMRKIEKGWKQYNVDDPWDVVFPKKNKMSASL